MSESDVVARIDKELKDDGWTNPLDGQHSFGGQVDEIKGGLVVPPHISKLIFADIRRMERERLILRCLLLLKATVWIILSAYALWSGRANWPAFLLLLFLGASVGELAIFLRSLERLSRKAPRNVARWGVERKGKGMK